MRSSTFYNIVLTLFVAGLLLSAYFLYSLPVLLEENSASVTPDVIEELSPVFLKLYSSVGITLLLGLYCVFSLFAKSKKQKVVEKIVYVDKKEDTKEGEIETSENDQAILGKIKEIEEEIKQKRTFNTKCDALINTLCRKIEASQGIFYQTVRTGSKRQIRMIAAYAFSLPDSDSLTFEFGEGLAGQSAKEGKSMKIDDVPEGYITILSGLGSASPGHLLIKPIIINGDVEAIVELASFKSFTANDEKIIDRSISLLENELTKEKDSKKEEKPGKTDGNPPKKDK